MIPTEVPSLMPIAKSARPAPTRPSPGLRTNLRASGAPLALHQLQLVPVMKLLAPYALPTLILRAVLLSARPVLWGPLPPRARKERMRANFRLGLCTNCQGMSTALLQTS